ncbi:MFS transporter, partial [uncultured Sphingorhabdus sp.]|uniref:spinster family MFS transporter n=1 Tax=uncultured Sphingorhabdus sp. TaxID=1686106 RepID=UPI002615F15E
MLTTEAAKADLPKSPNSLRLTLWVLLIVYIFNFLDRQIVNILAEPISRDLGLSDTQIGLMTGIAFAAFYTFLGIPIARYADRPKTNRVGLISVSLIIWSGMTALCGTAQNFVQLLLARIGVGVGEAGCTPAAHSLIADLAPPEKRASAISFYSLGIPIGSLLGMVIGGMIADAYGWRAAFLVAGLPGIALAAIVFFVLRDPRMSAHLKAAEPKPAISTAESFKEILASRAFIMLAIGGAMAAFLSYGKATWTTIFFQRTHELSPGEVGFWFGIGGGIAGIIGTFAGGWFADKYGKVNRRHVLTAPAIGMLVAIPIAISAYWVENWWYALILIMTPTFLNSMYVGPAYSCAQGLVPLRARAMASAVLLFAQNLIGLGLGPLFFGMLSDGIRPMAGDESVRWVLYGAALLGLIPSFF